MTAFRNVVIEVCVDSVESALASASAVRGGADRLELCANLGVGGGTTPSLGLVKQVQKAVPGIPIMAMIRPRTGDFMYTDHEINVMAEDIQMFKEAGVVGVVLGILREDGSVDVGRTQSLTNGAMNLEGRHSAVVPLDPTQTITYIVCVHRAFDVTSGTLEKAFLDVMSISGITRLLTSGRGKTAPTSLGILQDLCRMTQGRPLSILPGAGLNVVTVEAVLKSLLPLGLREIHLSGGKWVRGKMVHRPAGMGFGMGDDEWGIWETDEETIREVRSASDRCVGAVSCIGVKPNTITSVP